MLPDKFFMDGIQKGARISITYLSDIHVDKEIFFSGVIINSDDGVVNLY